MSKPHQLKPIIQRAHSLGRKLRIYGMKNSERLWSYALKMDLDLISVDELSRAHDFFMEYPGIFSPMHDSEWEFES